MLQMHDELDVSAGDEGTAIRLGEILRGVGADTLSVPMKVDLEYGVNWGDSARKRPFAAVLDESRNSSK